MHIIIFVSKVILKILALCIVPADMPACHDLVHVWNVLEILSFIEQGARFD